MSTSIYPWQFKWINVDQNCKVWLLLFQLLMTGLFQYNLCKLVYWINKNETTSSKINYNPQYIVLDSNSVWTDQSTVIKVLVYWKKKNMYACNIWSFHIFMRNRLAKDSVWLKDRSHLCSNLQIISALQQVKTKPFWYIALFFMINVSTSSNDTTVSFLL